MSGTTFVLPDGGELEEPTDAAIEQVGDRWLPSPLYYRHPGGRHSAPYEVKLEVWNGIPVCTEIRMTSDIDTGTHIRVRDLRALESILEERIEDWLSLVAYIRMPAPPGRRKFRRAITDPADRAAAMKAVRSGRRQIRRAGKSHLQVVADVYNSTSGPKGEAVMRALNVSMPTARRYIRDARNEGLLT